jgi:hypothetical protein
MTRPNRWQMLFFWLILAVFSTFFAEVTIGSAPLVFFQPFGLLVTMPIYGLHTLVLAALVIRPGRRVRWQALFLAGTLLGMYEAYITKMLWDPTWNAYAWRIGGVGVLEFGILVLFWHPFMAFVVPLFAAEQLANLQPMLMNGLSPRWRAWLGDLRRRKSRAAVAGVGVLVGALHGSVMSAPANAIGSALPTLLGIGILLWLWQKIAAGASYSMADLLPRGRAWWIILLALCGYYLFGGFVLRPEALPGLGSQVTIWVIYAGLIGMLLLARRKLDSIELMVNNLEAGLEPAPGGVFHPSLRVWLLFSLAFLLTSIASSLIFGALRDFVVVGVWVVGIPLGLLALYQSVRWLSRRPAVNPED